MHLTKPLKSLIKNMEDIQPWKSAHSYGQNYIENNTRTQSLSLVMLSPNQLEHVYFR